MATTVRENQAQASRETGVLVRGLFPGWKNRDGTELIFRLMQRLGKPFFQFVRGDPLPLAENLLLAIPTTRFQFIAFPMSTAAGREALAMRRRNLRPAFNRPKPHRPDSKLFTSVLTTLRQADREARLYSW